MKALAYLVLFFLAAALPQCLAQQASTSATSDLAVKLKLHDDAETLVELMGLRQQLQNNKEKMVQAGKDAVLKNYPNYDRAYIDEWGKRMLTQMNLDEYVRFVVSVYEKHFTDDEIIGLMQAQRDKNAAKTPNISSNLREKLAATMIAVQSEIIGGFTQIGAKAGGEIGVQIEKEHPEWIKTAKPTSATTN